MERTLDGYQLTGRGEELISLLKPFGDWSLDWAEEGFGLKDHPAFKAGSSR